MTTDEALLLREFIAHTLNSVDKQTSPQNMKYLLLKVLNDNSKRKLPENILEQPFLIAKVIFQFLNGFYEAEREFKPPTDLPEKYEDLLYCLINQRGVCRHQAELANIFKVFGIESDIILNDTHAYNVIKLDEQSFIFDLNYFNKFQKQEYNVFQKIRTGVAQLSSEQWPAFTKRILFWRYLIFKKSLDSFLIVCTKFTRWYE